MAASPIYTQLGGQMMLYLYDTPVGPVAGPETRGARYRDWRQVCVDGSTRNVADEPDNDVALGRPGASHSETGFCGSILCHWSRTALTSCLTARCPTARRANWR